MTAPWWVSLLGDAWRMAAAGFICVVLIGLFAGTGAPAEPEDDGEEIPEDPDRERDWDIADAQGAL